MRVQPAVAAPLDRLHGATARDDALGQHLPAEDPPVRLLLALAAEQRDVLGEGLGQRHRRLARRPSGRRHRLHAHLRRPELLEVEGGEEVEQGRRLVGGHRGNDSQGPPSLRRRTWVKSSGYPKVFTHVRGAGAGQATSGRPPGCPVPTRRPPRGAAAGGPHDLDGAGEPLDGLGHRVGRQHVGQPHPALQATDQGEPRAGRDEQPLVLGGHGDPGGVDAVGQLAPQEEPAPGHPEAQLGQAGRQGGDQGVARAAQVVPARRGEPGSHPHQLEQHQLLEHRCPEVAGDPRLDQRGEPGAGSTDPAGAQAAPVRLRRAADGDRPGVVRGERQRHRAALEVDLGDRLVDDGHGAGVPQRPGQDRPVVVAHEGTGRVVEVGDQQRRAGRRGTHGAGGLGDVPAVGVHGERHEARAAAPGGLDGVGVAGRLDDDPVAVADERVQHDADAGDGARRHEHLVGRTSAGRGRCSARRSPHAARARRRSGSRRRRGSGAAARRRARRPRAPRPARGWRRR